MTVGCDIGGVRVADDEAQTLVLKARIAFFSTCGLVIIASTREEKGGREGGDANDYFSHGRSEMTAYLACAQP